MKAKIGKQVEEITNPKLEAAVLLFADCKNKISEIEADMEKHKNTIVEAAKEELDGIDAATISYISGESSVKVTFGWDIKVSDVDALKKALGKRFGDLVKVDTTYKPEAKLKEMTLNDNDLKNCLVIKEKTPAVALEKKV